jgi:hypothetical protein
VVVVVVVAGGGGGVLEGVMVVVVVVVVVVLLGHTPLIRSAPPPSCTRCQLRARPQPHHPATPTLAPSCAKAALSSSRSRGYFSYSPTTSTTCVMLWLALRSGLPMMTWWGRVRAVQRA